MTLLYLINAGFIIKQMCNPSLYLTFTVDPFKFLLISPVKANQSSW